MPQAFYVLLGASVTVLVSLAIGRLVLCRLRVSFYREEQAIFAFVTGASLLSLLVFALTALGLAHKGVFLAVAVLSIAFAVRRGLHRFSGERLQPLSRLWRILFGVIFSAFTLLYFFNAMAPEISPDGSAYHLGLVARYYREHGFHRITTQMYANLSQGVEMLYLFAFAFGRHSAAALVHFSFLVTLPLAMLCYARRFGFATAGAAGALIAYLSPVIGKDGISAYNDVALACVLFTLFYLLQIWAEEKKAALLVPVGLLAGFGFAIKYTAFLALPYAICFVGWKLRRAKEPVIRPVLVVAVLALVLIAPWMVKNWLWVSNPVSPFLNSTFPNPYVHVSFEKDYAQHMRTYADEGLKSRWDIPIELTIRGGALQGLLGPLFLLAPLSFLALSQPAGRQLLLAALVFGLPYAANIGARFLIPAIPFVALAMGMVFSRYRLLPGAIVVAHAVLSWPPVVSAYCNSYAQRLDRIPFRAALRLVPEENYLLRELSGYLPARLVETEVPKGVRVLTFNQVADAYMNRDVIVAYQSAFGNKMQDLLWTPLIPDFQPTRRWVFRFPRQPVRRLRLSQTAAGGPDLWSISELRVFSEGHEINRSTQWKASAHPNPWDAALALDQKPVTRWRSWQELFPGMYFELDLGRETMLDTVALDCTRDQYKARMELATQAASGGWRDLGAPSEEATAAPADLRRMATAEVKASGIGYLLIDAGDLIAKDLSKNPEQWSATFITARGNTRLYRLD